MAASPVQYVPTERVIVRPTTQGIFKPGQGGQDSIKFLIPPSLAYVDTNDLVLRATVTMKGPKGFTRPNPRGGASSLFRQVQIRSGGNNAVLESIDSYNGLCAATMPFEANESIQALRSLTEGVDQGNPITDSSAQSSIYWKALEFADYNAGNQTQVTSTIPEAHPVQIEMPFHRSGILGSGVTFPVAATGGLRVEMQLDMPSRGLSGYTPPKPFKMSNQIAPGQFSTLQAQGQYPLIAQNTEFAGTPPYPNLGMWRPGQKVLLNMSNGQALQDVYVNAVHVPPDGYYHLVLEYRGNLPNYPPAAVNIGAVASIVYDINESSYELSDVALVMNRVTPPDGYQKSLMKQVESSAGLNMEFKTYSMVRNTLSAQVGMLSQNVPCTHSQAYSILSIPYNAGLYGVWADAFVDDFTGAKSYQYFIEGEAVPNRPVDLTAIPKHLTAPVQLWELQKALRNCGIVVRNLTALKGRNLLGRSLSVQNQVADLSNADIRLQTEYETTTAGDTTKQYDHHVCFCAKLTVRDNIVSVQR